jgi:hypothetical protein
MGMPHRNHVPHIAARCPDHHHKAAVKESRGDKAGLAAAAAIRCARGVQAGKDCGGAGEIKASLPQGLGALGFKSS